jgi:hypothetical protein
MIKKPIYRLFTKLKAKIKVKIVTKQRYFDEKSKHLKEIGKIYENFMIAVSFSY